MSLLLWPLHYVGVLQEQLLQEARRMETAAKACALGTATHPPDPEKADADRGPTNADGAGTQGEGPAHRRVVHGLFVVLDASGINFLDLSGLKGLVDISRWAKGGGGLWGWGVCV